MTDNPRQMEHLGNGICIDFDGEQLRLLFALRKTAFSRSTSTRRSCSHSWPTSPRSASGSRWDDQRPERREGTLGCHDAGAVCGRPATR